MSFARKMQLKLNDQVGGDGGSILSPVLFALYVDELLIELRALGIGCKVAGI